MGPRVDLWVEMLELWMAELWDDSKAEVRGDSRVDLSVEMLASL